MATGDRPHSAGDMVGSQYADWFMYFPTHYRWSAALLSLLGTAPYGGSDVGEVSRVAQNLVDCVGDDQRWFDEWRAKGEQLRRQALNELECGHELTAGSLLLRACSYLQVGERFRASKDDLALSTYRLSVDCFHRYISLTPWPRIEPVSIPYGRARLPAYFVLPDLGRAAQSGAGKVPCVVYFDGLDISKELQFVRGVSELTRRGLACLIVDGPGCGEAIRSERLRLCHDYERAGKAAIAYLAGRSDVDMGRVAVMAISLGGYYATRIAAKASGYSACVAWGGIWDYHEVWRRRLESSLRSQLSVPADHLTWVLGVSRVDEALKALEPFRLDGVAQGVECPFLMLHGEHDEQVPLADALQLFSAIASNDKTLRIFTGEDGGAQHCQRDYFTLAATVIADWLSERLGTLPVRPIVVAESARGQVLGGSVQP